MNTHMDGNEREKRAKIRRKECSMNLDLFFIRTLQMELQSPIFGCLLDRGNAETVWLQAVAP